MGCASSPWKRELYEPTNAGVAVYLESKLSDAGQALKLGYAHPLTLPVDQLAGFLAVLRYSEDEIFGGRTEDVLFTAEEVNRIAPPLARALAAVGQNQRVRFVSMRTSKRYTLFRVIDCTAAVIFATAPDKIHIAFDYIHEELAEESADPEEVRLHREPTQSLDDEFTIIPPEEIFHHRANGRVYPRWITATPERMQAVAAATAAESSTAAVAASVPVAPPSAPADGPLASRSELAGTAKTGDASVSAPQTVVLDFHGYAIVRVGDRFYGLPKGESTTGTSADGVLQGDTAGAVIDAILAAESPRDP
jgi:hypothetical protein